MSEGYAGGSAGVRHPGAGAYGGLFKRFVARVVDGLLVGLTVTVLFAVIPGVGTRGFVYGVVSTAASFGYFVYLESSRGGTLGKQLLGLRVVGLAGGSPITPEASARRNAWILLGLLSGLPLIGFLAGLASLGIVIAIAVTISSDPRNQGLHDRFGGTLVLERPQPA